MPGQQLQFVNRHTIVGFNAHYVVALWVLKPLDQQIQGYCVLVVVACTANARSRELIFGRPAMC